MWKKNWFNDLHLRSDRPNCSQYHWSSPGCCRGWPNRGRESRPWTESLFWGWGEETERRRDRKTRKTESSPTFRGLPTPSVSVALGRLLFRQVTVLTAQRYRSQVKLETSKGVSRKRGGMRPIFSSSVACWKSTLRMTSRRKWQNWRTMTRKKITASSKQVDGLRAWKLLVDTLSLCLSVPFFLSPYLEILQRIVQRGGILHRKKVDVLSELWGRSDSLMAQEQRQDNIGVVVHCRVLFDRCSGK